MSAESTAPTSTVEPFGRRLQRAVAEHGPLLAGIDPHRPLLEAWGLPDTAAGAEQFGLRLIEAVAGHVAMVKPQSAFFERHGAAGVAALESVLAAARARGLLTILDVKRGDIGSTMDAYAQAHLLPGAGLEADAITASPYLGVGSLRGTVSLALEHGKGVFVLALTSNPDGPEVQHARRGDTPVARRVAEFAERIGGGSADHWGSVGLVVGATVGSAYRDLGLDQVCTSTPLLAPGFGAQGAGPAQMPEVFGEDAARVLVAVSRGLLAAGPDPSALAARAQELSAQYR